MKPYESEDDLDRALFALPLEEPPADLRANILAATIYSAPIAVKPWEVWTIGALFAVLAWMLAAIARGTAAPVYARVTAEVAQAFAVVSAPQVLFWIALGVGAAFWISQLNLTLAPGASRAVRR